MATSDKSRQADNVPADILPLIRKAGILSEKAFADLRARVLRGDYPLDSRELAQRLIREKILTEYQARRLLSNKSHGMAVGRYVILDRLGSGSMGRVYKAHHLMMDRIVALKIIAPEVASNQRVVARFQREMKLVGRLDHPNVVRAFDADQIGNILYIVMEYVAGESLSLTFRRTGAMPALDVVDLAAQAASGLAHAHGQGVVHRDIKPSNLLLGCDRQLKVLDLGLGVLMEADNQATFATADGIAVGTVDYMSPEQACGKEVDGRSDLYSLGCSMYYLISGQLPFPGESPIERLGRRINQRPVPLADLVDLPPGLAGVMEGLLANKPHERFQTALEAAEALRGLLPRKTPPPLLSFREGVEESPASTPVAPPIEPEVIEVAPTYPAWFRPLAALAEQSGAGALLVVIAILLLTFGIGFITALLVR